MIDVDTGNIIVIMKGSKIKPALRLFRNGVSIKVRYVHTSS